MRKEMQLGRTEIKTDLSIKQDFSRKALNKWIEALRREMLRKQIRFQCSKGLTMFQEKLIERTQSSLENAFNFQKKGKSCKHLGTKKKRLPTKAQKMMLILDFYLTSNIKVLRAIFVVLKIKQGKDVLEEHTTREVVQPLRYQSLSETNDIKITLIFPKKEF